MNLEIFSGKTSALLLLQGLNVAGSEFMHRHAELASTFTVVVDSRDYSAAKAAAACVCVQRLSSGRKARLWRLQRLLLLFREETRKRVGRKRRLCLLKCSKHFFSLEFFFCCCCCYVIYNTKHYTVATIFKEHILLGINNYTAALGREVHST